MTKMVRLVPVPMTTPPNIFGATEVPLAEIDNVLVFVAPKAMAPDDADEVARRLQKVFPAREVLVGWDMALFTLEEVTE